MTANVRTLKASVLQVALALGAVYLIWGSTYLAMRFAIATIPPFLMAGTRYLTAGAILYGWARWRGAPRPSRPFLPPPRAPRPSTSPTRPASPKEHPAR